MMRIAKIILTCCMMAASASALFAQSEGEGRTIVLGKEIMPKDTTKQYRFTNRLIVPKGSWQCGISVMYADFSSDNTEYMLMLQGLNANASMLRLAPEAAYAYSDNHAVGAKFQYTNMNGMMDSMTADLLGNFSMTLEEVSAASRAMSASVFHRTYVGLDNHGRVGLFWDYILGLTRTRTQFAMAAPSDAFSLTQKIHLGFAPGIVYFPMNNVSVQASISLADVSYSNVKAYEEGNVLGERQAWKAMASLNLLGLSFGLTVHL